MWFIKFKLFCSYSRNFLFHLQDTSPWLSGSLSENPAQVLRGVQGSRLRQLVQRKQSRISALQALRRECRNIKEAKAPQTMLYPGKVAAVKPVLHHEAIVNLQKIIAPIRQKNVEQCINQYQSRSYSHPPCIAVKFRSGSINKRRL